LVEGIRKDPGACLRALRQPMAFLFLEGCYEKKKKRTAWNELQDHGAG
jgi:hypothetical protein